MTLSLTEMFVIGCIGFGFSAYILGWLITRVNCHLATIEEIMCGKSLAHGDVILDHNLFQHLSVMSNSLQFIAEEIKAVRDRATQN